VRALVSPLTSDRASSDDIESIAGLIARGDLG
jgi:histidine ammonia-lyase